MGGKEKTDGEKVYFCSYDDCGMKFNRPSRLQWHIRQHTGEKPFKCDISDCDKAYVSSTKLKRHQKTFHKSDGGDGGEGEINTAAAQEDGEGNIQPALVTTTDDSAAAPRIPAAVEVAYPTPESSIASDLHRCDSVNSLGSMIGSPGAFSYSTSCASSEVDGTEYKYKCEVVGCQKSFKTKMNLYNHRVVQHEKRDRFRCEVEGCDKAFAFPTLLKSHMKTHRGYNCEHCGEKFQKWTDVRKHVSSQHKKVHACTQCSKTFQRPCDLHRHQLTHSGSKVKYTCPEEGCGKSYDRVATLRKHISHQHHGELPYKCQHEECVAAFPNLHDLQRHMRYHAKDKNEPKQYPAKGHRKIPLIGRLVGPLSATSTVLHNDNTQAAHKQPDCVKYPAITTIQETQPSPTPSQGLVCNGTQPSSVNKSRDTQTSTFYLPKPTGTISTSEVCHNASVTMVKLGKDSTSHDNILSPNNNTAIHKTQSQNNPMTGSSQCSEVSTVHSMSVISHGVTGGIFGYSSEEEAITGQQKVVLCQSSHVEKTVGSHEFVDSGFHERSQSDANSVILNPCGDNRGSGFDNHYCLTDL